jgi:hypothetical protein
MLTMRKVIEEVGSDADNDTGRGPGKEVAGDEQAAPEAGRDHVCRRRELREVDEQSRNGAEKKLAKPAVLVNYGLRGGRISKTDTEDWKPLRIFGKLLRVDERRKLWL